MNVDVNPNYPLFPVVSFVSSFLVLVPLPWHIQAWNIGTCAYIFWASMACLIEFVNSVVWRSNTLNLVPVWCDISSKFLLGASVGIPAAGLCISRRLYVISAIKSTIVTRQDKRRAVIIDSCIAFGLPMIVMALHCVVQDHRFDILEDIGCYPAIYNTLLSYVLVFSWPILLGCVSFVFSALTLWAFCKRRMELNQFLATHGSLSMSRYVRLMMLAASEMLCTIPLSVISTYVANQGSQIQPWVSWQYVHYDFSYVGQIPSLEWRGNPNSRLSVEMTRWLFPASALLFFSFFGFASEARKNYRAAFLRVAKCFGYKPALEVPVHVPYRVKPDLNKHTCVGSLPVYVTTPCVDRTDLLVGSTDKCFNTDMENTAGCSSPSVCSSSQDELPSHTGAGTERNVEESCHVMAARPPLSSVYRHTIPAYHRPFSLPSIYPIPNRTMQESRPLEDVCITVQQSQHRTAA